MDHHGLAMRRLEVAGLGGLRHARRRVRRRRLVVGRGHVRVGRRRGRVPRAGSGRRIFPKDAAETAATPRRRTSRGRPPTSSSSRPRPRACSPSRSTSPPPAGTPGADKGLLIALAIVSVALAWASVHTVFLLRYARLYYDPPAGGIDFNEDEPPDYRDFAYVALHDRDDVAGLGHGSDARAPIRRTAIRHALLSFVFGSVIVAITINVVASLLNG